MMRILCAVRGGPDSEKTIKYAISLVQKEEVSRQLSIGTDLER